MKYTALESLALWMLNRFPTGSPEVNEALTALRSTERAEQPAEPFPIGTHVRWHDAGEDASTGIVITHVAYAWLRVVSPKIVSKTNDLQSNYVRPKPPQDAFSDEWGKWWWDTRHTRGRVP